MQSYRDRHRNDQCLLMVAVCLSTVSILLTIACGISVVSMREKNLDYETRLRRLEDRNGHWHSSVQQMPDLTATSQDLKVTEKVLKNGNCSSAFNVSTF